MKDRLNEALKRSSAEYTEIRYELDDMTRIAYRGAEAEDVSTSRHRGGIVRACVKGGWGIATFDDLGDLDASVDEACQCAALAGNSVTALAELPPAKGEYPAQLGRDFRGVDFDDKLHLVQRYNHAILAHHEVIESSVAVYSESFRNVHFASSNGGYYFEERPRVVVALMAVARNGANVQRALESFATATSYDDLANLDEQASNTAQVAIDLLKAPPCEGGKKTVVVDPDLGGVFVHEAFGHLSEADHLYENDKMRELMHLGRRVGVDKLNIVDDGTYGRTIATHAYDDEGTPTSKTYLVRGGELTGHLHSIETAAKMSARPTGNARAIDRRHPPIVRMTNTYIEPGDKSFDELISDVDDGVYAVSSWGGQTMLEMFTFSARRAYRIEKGQVGELVRDVVLTGNVFETLNAMDGFGDDLRVIQTGGGCGKGGQAPLPVTHGAPHLRIRDVVIGGR